jgi:hypothetical protein
MLFPWINVLVFSLFFSSFVARSHHISPSIPFLHSICSHRRNRAVLLPATHPTSPLSGRPPHHTHPTPSLLDTPTHPITSAPCFQRVRHAQDIGVKNFRLALVLAIRSAWSWAPPSRPPWCFLLTWVRHTQDVGVKNFRLALVLTIRSAWSWAPPSRPPCCLLLTWAVSNPLPRCASRRQRHKQEPRLALEVDSSTASASCLCGAPCRDARGRRWSSPSWSCSFH